MAHVSYSDLRSNLASYMDQVCDNRAPLLVTRQNARSVVILSEAESMLETLHLLRNPNNAARLRSAIAKADQGLLTPHDLLEAEGNAGA